MYDFINIIILALLGSIIFNTKDEELMRKVKYLDKKLDRIMEHLGIEEQNYDEELEEFLKNGKKIKAIKFLREATGMGLKEAKEYVDELEREFFKRPI